MARLCFEIVRGSQRRLEVLGNVVIVAVLWSQDEASSRSCDGITWNSLARG